MNQNIVGTTIGIIKVLYQCDCKSNDGHKLFHVMCTQCGWESDVQARHIYRLSNVCKHTNSAGQYIQDNWNLKWKIDRIKNIYFGIIQRCYNTNEKSYHWYGEKGVKLCDEWLNNPLEFEQWSLSNGYADNLTIDRIDSTKDYSPDNCRWVTPEENSKYTSTTRLIKVNNEIHTGRDWSAILGLGTNTINKMLAQYSEEAVKEFISKRLQDKTKKRKSKQTWMNVYNVTIN